MKLRVVLLMALTIAFTMSITANAGSMPQTRSSAVGAPQAKVPARLMYACSICHHQVSAAQAKKLHYICPVDHGKLIPVRAASPSKPG